MIRKGRKGERALIHESIQIGILLAMVGGFLDAYTYIFRGGVFANAQTGNMILMGLHAAAGDFLRASYYLIPIAAFFLGILLTEWMRKRLCDTQWLRWEHIILVIEIGLLFLIGFLPAAVPAVIVNVLIAFVCSVQVGSFRKTKGLPYATTMCTGNLRYAAEKFYLFLFERDSVAGRQCLRYLVIILAFCIGAILGGWLTGFFGGRAVWACCLILTGVFGILSFGKTSE